MSKSSTLRVMKRLFMLVFVVLLTACGGTNSTNNPPPDGGNTQVKDGFEVTVSPTKENFFVGIGETNLLSVTAKITKPEAVSRVKVSVSSDYANISLSPVEKILSNGQVVDIAVSVKPEAKVGEKPFFSLFVQSLDSDGNPLAQISPQVFQWTLQ
jgi:hypothetical protein